jgi:hypothetical protein
MSIIPLDVQRRCERRWAARFRPTESASPRNQRPERESQQIAGPDKGERKAPGLKRRARELYRPCERGTEAPRVQSGLDRLSSASTSLGRLAVARGRQLFL